MNRLDDATFARFAERFAGIERRVPEPPPLGELAAGRRRAGRLSLLTATVAVVVLLAGAVGLAMLGALPVIDSGPDSSASMLPTASPTSRPPAGQSTILRGRVVDADGMPVPQATVTAYLRPEGDAIAGSARTDANGRWVVSLPAGNTYCLGLQVDIPVPGNAAPTRFGSSFGPSGIDQPTSSWPCLEPAGEVVLDVTLPVLRLLSGSVVNEVGEPIKLSEAGGPFTRIEVAIGRQPMGSTSEADANGRYTIWVPEGTVSAFAWVFRDQQAFMSPATPLVVGPDPVTDLVLTVDTSTLIE